MGLQDSIVPARPRTALVLMGGGARTAYQVGVLQAIAAMLQLQPGASSPFPFQVLVGTSAGALNVAWLAAAATRGLDAFAELARFWGGLHCRDVYELQVPAWVRVSRLATALQLFRRTQDDGALLDTMPLVDSLHRAISLPAIDDALAAGAIDVLAVTASSYTSGVHWTFCHTGSDSNQAAWLRPGRRAEFQPITIEHLMASSAIPFLFPATPLWVDGRREYFGDGAMRQVSPLSPAMHLRADKILVVGAGQPRRTSLAELGGHANGHANGLAPSLGGVAGHAMASVFHDTLEGDVEHAQRITHTLRQLPRELAGQLPYRSVDVLAIQPTQSLDALAQQHAHELPASVRRALGGLGALRTGGAALASYLLFEPGFVQSLIALGEQDAYARKEDLLAFFTA